MCNNVEELPDQIDAVQDTVLVRLLQFFYKGSEKIERFFPHFVAGMAKFIREMLQDPEVFIILSNLEAVVESLI